MEFKDPRIGRVLAGRYRLVSQLAKGGMGVVYRAERVGIGGPVAVKFLHAVLATHQGILDRFEREAQATARLNHPHCVSLVDFGIDEESPYLVMEFVEGETLHDLLDDGAFAPARALLLVRQLLFALAHAHARGILHRDLKPANIMLLDVEGMPDFVKILDFGLATRVSNDGEPVDRELTGRGMAVGTPGYMSPEQAAGKPADQRADIYCAGAVLYHLVTGTRAFGGRNPHSMMRRHREDTPPKPREVAPKANVSPELEAVILKAMQRDPALRYASADEMGRALEMTPEAEDVIPRATRQASSALTAGKAKAGADSLLELEPESLAGATVNERTTGRTWRSGWGSGGASGAMRWVGVGLFVGIVVGGAFVWWADHTRHANAVVGHAP